MHDRMGAAADALEADRHGEAAACLQRVFGERGRAVVDVPAVYIVADFEEHGEHGEHDRAGIHHARGKVVDAAAQQPARDPERERRNAVTIENPVEDRRDAAEELKHLPAIDLDDEENE